MASDVLDEGGEGYFASVSDLMVGILFVFLLMLTVFAVNLRAEEDQQKIEVKKYEQLQEELKREREAVKAATELADQEKQRASEQERQALLEKAAAEKLKRQNDELLAKLSQAADQLERDIKERENARTRLLSTLESTLKERGVQVFTDPESGILRLPEDVLFATGRSDLKPEATSRLRVLADTLEGVLPCFSEKAGAKSCPDGAQSILETLLIEGHSDSQKWGSAADSQERNDRLSTERALAVFKALRQAQPSLGAIQNGHGQPLLGVSGYGDRRPRPDALRSVEEDFSKNRRIDLRFVLSSRTTSELQRLRDEIRSLLEPKL